MTFRNFAWDNKIREMKRALIFVVKTEIYEKNSSNRNATWYKWVLVLAQHVTNTHLYHVALRFHEFFHGIFKPPRKTNGNLKLVVLLVESNTMIF